MQPTQPTVSIIDQGREGQVVYTEDAGSISGYREFGVGDVLAVISMGSADEWQARQRWAIARRAQILRFVADEMIRQKAPGFRAEIDEARGTILLRGQPGAAPAAPRSDAAWMARYAALKVKLGLIVLVIGVVLAAGAWVKSKVLVVATGPGTPMGSTVRSDTHLATLIQTLQPYTPSLQGDPSAQRNTLSLLLVPLDGSAPTKTTLLTDLRHGSYSLARVIGSDGQRMWVNANGLLAVDLRTQHVVTPEALRRANPQVPAQWLEDARGADVIEGHLQLLSPDHATALAVDPASLKAAVVAPQRLSSSRLSPPSLGHYMAAGVRVAPRQWLGVYSASEMAQGAKPGRWLRPVESARDAREPRRLVRGELDPGGAAPTGSQRIVAMTPLGHAEYQNAAFLRADDKAEPLRLHNPDSVLMLHTVGDALPGGTLAVSRVGIDGQLLWTTDTALHRFKLQQVLPGAHSTAFVGTRPPVPDQVSEPLLVIVDHASGRAITQSLWR